LPKRVWREIDEKSDDYQANFTIPISTTSKFKHGFVIRSTHRDATERRFEYVNNAYYTSFDGDIESYVEDMGLDTVTSRVVSGQTRYRYRFSNILKEYIVPENNYSGDKGIFATYAMLEIPVFKHLYFVGGVRYEETDMRSMSKGGQLLGKGISDEDLLPALNLTYRISDRINVRASFGKTLARPSLKEISSAKIEAFNDNEVESGNPNLKISRIDNYDLRWEWFVNPGEIIAVSAFYKKLRDPIEKVILNSVHREIQPQNAPNATVRGFELEYRRRLGFVTNTLRNFRLGGNYTYVKSEIKLSDVELKPARFVDPDFPDTRPLWGQSPYVLNLDFGFDSFATGTSLSVYYNVFGKRLKYNSPQAEPDIYERPGKQLDFTASQKLLAGATLKLA
ncbi:MAG: TonB-dependent receptor domain-containing protein, partial [Candidatus Zixiibacteriota bacterium]